MQGKKADKKVDSTDVVKCKTCGADMYFDIASGKLRCPYCDNTVEAKARNGGYLVYLKVLWQWKEDKFE
ncbi:MAG: hypothetical protein BHV97_04160 [Clostridium sp. CAG:349_48_7]|nr:MAG: hypothetical protein BHV97_04160 [Clostridium sp. CAG:349_48_7]